MLLHSGSKDVLDDASEWDGETSQLDGLQGQLTAKRLRHNVDGSSGVFRKWHLRIYKY